jgi:hypothetical protein
MHDRVFFLIEMSDDDYYVLLTVCRSLGMTKQNFIMNALREYIKKIQEDWKRSKEVNAGVGDVNV